MIGWGFGGVGSLSDRVWRNRVPLRLRRFVAAAHYQDSADRYDYSSQTVEDEGSERTESGSTGRSRGALIPTRR